MVNCACVRTGDKTLRRLGKAEQISGFHHRPPDVPVVLVVLVAAERCDERQAVDENDHRHQDENDFEHGGAGVVNLARQRA
jgi:hypothetical protein